MKFDSCISRLWFHSRTTLAALRCSQYVPLSDSKFVLHQRNYHQTSTQSPQKRVIKVFNDSRSIHHLCKRRSYETTYHPVAQLTSLSHLSRQACSSLSSEISNLSDDDLLNLLDQLAEQKAADQITDQNYLISIDRIDEECIRRAASWNFTSFMEFLRRYSTIRPARSSGDRALFWVYAMNRRITSAVSAPLPVLLEYLRILNEAKIWFKYIQSKHLLADILDGHFDKLSWPELDILLEPISFQGCILNSDKLKKKICQKVIDDFENVTSARLTHIFRIFHAQTQFPKNFLFITPWLLHILDSLVANIDSFDLECLLCAGQLCSQMFIYDPRILKAIAQRLMPNLGDLEPAKVAAAVSVLTHFNFQSDSTDLYANLVTALEENEMFLKFCNKPRLLMQILSNLSLVGAYSHRYLDTVFSDTFLRKLLGHKINRYRVTPELFILHGSSALECPKYAGTRLEPQLLDLSLKNRSYELPGCLRKPKVLGDVHAEKMPTCLRAPRTISTYYRTLYCTRGLLDEILGGNQYTHVCFLLPQFKRATIIFGLDANGQPVPIPKELRQERIVGRDFLDRRLDWYAFVFKSDNVYTSSEPMLMGDEIAKDRQLRQCGIKVLSITQHGWLKMSIEDKLKILRDEISKQAVNLKAVGRP